MNRQSAVFTVLRLAVLLLPLIFGVPADGAVIVTSSTSSPIVSLVPVSEAGLSGFTLNVDPSGEFGNFDTIEFLFVPTGNTLFNQNPAGEVSTSNLTNPFFTADADSGALADFINGFTVASGSSLDSTTRVGGVRTTFGSNLVSTFQQDIAQVFINGDISTASFDYEVQFLDGGGVISSQSFSVVIPEPSTSVICMGLVGCVIAGRRQFVEA